MTHQMLQIRKVLPQLRLVVVHQKRVGHDDQRPATAQGLKDAAAAGVAASNKNKVL